MNRSRRNSAEPEFLAYAGLLYCAANVAALAIGLAIEVAIRGR